MNTALGMGRRTFAGMSAGSLLLGLLRPSAASAEAPQSATAAAPDAPAAAVKPLTVTPVSGYIGETFAVAGDGLPASAPVQFLWVTADGEYSTQVYSETIEFYERKYTEKRVLLGEAITDAEGRVAATFPVPDDYGEVHDLFAVVGGEDVARGGYRILPEFVVSPLEGAVGTPITVKAKGIGIKVWENTWGVTYDNKYTGFITAVTTRGTAAAGFRAAGPVGKHTIDIWHAGQAVPYINWEQSPQAHIPVFNVTFEVSKDGIAPPLTLEEPRGPAVTPATIAITTASSEVVGTSGSVSATISPASGAVLSPVTLRATTLPANTPINVIWATARGSRTSGLGWGLAEIPLGTVTTDRNGVLTLPFQIPDDLGGWHTVKLVKGDQILAEAAYRVQPNLVEVTPTRVKVGDPFQIHIKGVGWTELDNIYAVTYDNAYIGFACGFNSSGDMTVNLHASGAPGVHLIDFYPTVYQGHGKPPWLYDTPLLTFSDDHPGLALGYRLPAFRLAINVE